MKRLFALLAIPLSLLLFALPQPAQEAAALPRGARPTPFPKIVEAIRAGKANIHKAAAAPAQVVVVPKRLSMWGNSQYGDCVTAESAFSIAAYSTFVGLDEIFVPEANVIAWARSHGWLNGADLLSVIQDMEADGIKDEAGVLRKAGKPSSVDYRSEATLQSAIASGPVSIAIDANALPSAAGNKSGWSAWGSRSYPNTDHCFTGDTMVSLLDGRELSFAELAAGAAGESFWVYSVDKDGNIVPGRAHSVRKTRENADLVKVTLDNGEEIRCTEDHRFMMRDGTYKEAKLLRPEDSLMPLYRKVSPGGYELYFNPRLKGKNGWRATHRMVAFGPACRTGGMAAHHVDFNKRNNDPSNLRVMTSEDHAALHQQFSRKNKTPEHRAMASELMKALWADPVWAARQRAKLAASASARAKKTAALGHAYLQTVSDEDRAEMSKRAGVTLRGRSRSTEAVKKGVESRRKRFEDDADYRESVRAAAKRASQAAALRPVTDRQREARRENARRLNAKNNDPNNHKVISVVPCGREDVYDLTVDEHHNFALSAGVFVHNCVSLHGYGPTSELFKALGVPVPAGAPANGYLLYTWSTIGVVDHAWLLNTCVEAWVRTPTTLDLPPPLPTPPPAPPPADVTVTVADVSGQVGATVKFSPSAKGGTSPYIFLAEYGDGGQDMACAHAYKSAGSYKVVISAVDAVGRIGTATCTATIGTTPPPPPPPPPGPGGLTITFPQSVPAGIYHLVPQSALDELQRQVDEIRGLSRHR